MSVINEPQSSQSGPNGGRLARRKLLATALTVISLAAVLTTVLLGGVLAPVPASGKAGSPVEPEAGQWHTWLLESGSQLRPPAPPSKNQTKAELDELRALAAQRDPAALDQIDYWNTGAPVYRWNEIALQELVKRGMNVFTGGRALALLHAAVYDATVAAWDAKYAYNRERPVYADRRIEPAIQTPDSPSYPSEHAAAAGAASEVLAYLFPEKAEHFRAKAAEAGEAMLLAGVNYRSDVDAGAELGRQVAEFAIQRAMNDGSTNQWDGTMPTGPGYWTGQNPAAVMAGTWLTYALESGSEFRPGPPPAYDSDQLAGEMDELRAYQRSPVTNSLALFWEWGSGGTRNHWFWNEQLSKKVLEHRLETNPPRAAQAYALESIALYDSMVACFDAKYTYWSIRPFQVDPAFQVLFTTPNHPSYPSAHSCLSTATAEILAELFPRDGQALVELANEASESRIWAGIHFRSDIVAGQQIGQSVADKVLEVSGFEQPPAAGRTAGER